MANLTVSVPDDVLDRLKAKLGPHGVSVEDFLTNSAHSLAEHDGAIPPDLEAKLLAALDTRVLDARHVDWDAKLRRLESGTA